MNGRRASSSASLQSLLLFVLAAIVCSPLAWSASPADKPPITLDEFFSFVGIRGLALSPDGKTAVIGTERADWYDCAELRGTAISKSGTSFYG